MAIVSGLMNIIIVFALVVVAESSIGNSTKQIDKENATISITFIISNVNQLKQHLKKINFQDLLRNKTIQEMIDPTLHEEYWQTLVKTSNLVDHIDDQNVVSMIESSNGGEISVLDLLRKVVTSFNPLRFLYNVDYLQLKSSLQGNIFF